MTAENILKIKQLGGLMPHSKKTMVLTGSGISTDSGPSGCDICGSVVRAPAILSGDLLPLAFGLAEEEVKTADLMIPENATDTPEELLHQFTVLTN